MVLGQVKNIITFRVPGLLESGRVSAYGPIWLASGLKSGKLRGWSDIDDLSSKLAMKHSANPTRITVDHKKRRQRPSHCDMESEPGWS